MEPYLKTPVAIITPALDWRRWNLIPVMTTQQLALSHFLTTLAAVTRQRAGMQCMASSLARPAATILPQVMVRSIATLVAAVTRQRELLRSTTTRRETSTRQMATGPCLVIPKTRTRLAAIIPPPATRPSSVTPPPATTRLRGITLFSATLRGTTTPPMVTRRLTQYHREQEHRHRSRSALSQHDGEQ